MKEQQREIVGEDFQPYLSIHEQYRDERSAKTMAVDARVIERMCAYGSFEMEEFMVAVSDRHGDILISLALLGLEAKEDSFPISGFPRNLTLSTLKSRQFRQQASVPDH